MKTWSLVNLLFILCIPLSCVRSATEEIHVSGYEGGQVNVSCPYGEGYESYEKYLCKNNCDDDNDVLIRMTEAKKNRYSVHDDKVKRVFTVTISDLRRTDAGKYWCGVNRRGIWDTYPAIVILDVVPEWCCVKSKQQSGTVGRPITLQCPYPTQHRDNRKFLCKGDHRSTCTDMVTHQSRFTMQDDVSSSSFSVRITELKAGDAGTYWCGSDSQWSVGTYTKIQLSVVVPQQTSTVTSYITVEPVGSQSTHFPRISINDTKPLNVVVFIVPPALLIMALALVIVCKCKVKGPAVNLNRNITEAAAVNNLYENVVSYRQQTHDGVDEDQQESVYEKNITTENIYHHLNI